jgi:hypothetical protein
LKQTDTSTPSVYGREPHLVFTVRDNIADPSQVIYSVFLLLFLCGKDLLYNNGGKKKRKSRRRDRGV